MVIKQSKKSFLFLLKAGRIITMEFNLMTSNIRFENPNDGKNNWPNRRDIWANIVNSYKIDILCTQEGREKQIRNANSCLNIDLVDNHRSWISERMYPSIFVNKKLYNVIESGDFWLSETPTEPGSKSFGSAFPRLCTWILLENKLTKFFVFNCHLDHVLPETRKGQSTVIVNEVLKLNKYNLPYLLVGDFNEDPTGSVRSNFNSALKINDPYFDIYNSEQGTHHRFDGKNERNSRIDWILTNGHIKCNDYEVIKYSQEGIYPSDHFPIYAKFSIN
jgi:endonuclease/exonuclease/phosphatase family metal-dependent hydrolase